MKRGLIAGSDPSVVAALQVLLYGQVFIDTLQEQDKDGVCVLGAVLRRTYDWVMIEQGEPLDDRILKQLTERTQVIVVGENGEKSKARNTRFLPKGARLSERLKSVLRVATVH